VPLGSHPSNDDATVSRFHCEVRVQPHGVTMKDFGRRNGTASA